MWFFYFSPLNHNLNNYLAPGYFYNFGIINRLAELNPILVMFLGIFLIKKFLFDDWFFLMAISIFGFICSLLSPMLAFPVNNIIADSALFFTIVLLLTFSVGLMYIISYLYKTVNRQISRPKNI